MLVLVAGSERREEGSGKVGNGEERDGGDVVWCLLGGWWVVGRGGSEDAGQGTMQQRQTRGACARVYAASSSSLGLTERELPALVARSTHAKCGFAWV